MMPARDARITPIADVENGRMVRWMVGIVAIPKTQLHEIADSSRHSELFVLPARIRIP